MPLLCSLIVVISLRLLLPSLLPMAAPRIAVDLSPFPIATVIGLLLSLAIGAGIAEEVALRGYLQQSLEQAYGIVPALLITGLGFWLAHIEKVSINHLPFHVVASIPLG